MAWDAHNHSAKYRKRASEASSRVKQLKARTSKSNIYKLLHDAALAEFYVFSSISDPALIATPSQLLAALQTMRAIEPDAGAEPFDQKAFRDARLKEIDLLTRRVELELV